MPALLGGLLVGLAKMLLWLLGYIIVKLFVLLGLSMVTYTGVSLILDVVKERVYSLLGSGGTVDFVTITLGLIKFDVFVSIILSALTLKVTINQLDKVTKFVWNNKY